MVVSDEFGGDPQCGGRANQLPPPMEMKGRKVKFAFTSDDTISAAGFQLKYNVTRLQEGKKSLSKCIDTKPTESFLHSTESVKRQDARKHLQGWLV